MSAKEGSRRRAVRPVKFAVLCAAAVTALAVASGPASAGVPNQGNPAYVLKVDNPNVDCSCPTAGKKIEGGNLGRTLYLSSNSPIDFVTIKSGTGAYVVSASFDTYKGKIKLSKDVSNYVVWTCPNRY